MDKQKLYDYLNHSVENTNPAVVMSMVGDSEEPIATTTIDIDKNKTYTAPEGWAYTEVNVDVQPLQPGKITINGPSGYYYTIANRLETYNSNYYNGKLVIGYDNQQNESQTSKQYSGTTEFNIPYYRMDAAGNGQYFLVIWGINGDRITAVNVITTQVIGGQSPGDVNGKWIVPVYNGDIVNLTMKTDS